MHQARSPRARWRWRSRDRRRRSRGTPSMLLEERTAVTRIVAYLAAGNHAGDGHSERVARTYDKLEDIRSLQAWKPRNAWSTRVARHGLGLAGWSTEWRWRCCAESFCGRRRLWSEGGVCHDASFRDVEVPLTADIHWEIICSCVRIGLLTPNMGISVDQTDVDTVMWQGLLKRSGFFE